MLYCSKTPNHSYNATTNSNIAARLLASIHFSNILQRDRHVTQHNLFEVIITVASVWCYWLSPGYSCRESVYNDVTAWKRLSALLALRECNSPIITGMPLRWCFIWCYTQSASLKTVEWMRIWDTTTLMWGHFNLRLEYVDRSPNLPGQNTRVLDCILMFRPR